MASLSQECKKWVSCVQQLDFKPVIESLQNMKSIKQDEYSNKVLVKVLLHLSHSADRCHKENLSKEIEIFTVADIICKSLTSFSDKDKLFSAIYYIQLYLFNKQYLNEAQMITTYLFPGRILNNDDLLETSKYYQIAFLWWSEIFKKFNKIAADSKTSKKSVNEDLSDFIKFHFQILKHCDENSKYVFLAFDAYMKTLSNIPFSIASNYLVQIFKEISSYICSLKKFPVTEAYKIILPAVGIAFYKRNDAINNKTILECFRQCDSYIHDVLKVSSQCYNSYKLFREYSLNIFETNFMVNEIGTIKFQKTFHILQILLDKYGTENDVVANTVTGLACSFETVFSNWEKLVSNQLTNSGISYDDILKMGEFVKCAYSSLKNRKFPTSYTCQKCPATIKCPAKTDIYNSTIAASLYLQVIAKFKLKTLNEKIFTIAKDIMKEMLLGYNELVKLGCKASTSLWNVCGRTIFNIGLACESDYPAQYEELYEVLCKEITQNEGLSSALGSFGLESPVATTLQRLCNVNFNQENYRKALSYTAYNALLSLTESRKRKAYDMWCSIKRKCSDSKEIQELTLVNCLKTDASIAKNVGIDVNLELYDTNNLYIQELKCLFPAKGNMITSIQTILAELASTKNDVYYARGVLMLCFHSLQHNNRKYIEEYITEAIKKLNAIKPRTASNECLIASLNFFNVLENLYAKRQAITKQMEDANFTVKSFKASMSKKLDYEEEQNEIVPTYGNISIEEDEKFAKKLRDLLTIWDSYITRDLNAIIKGWEPEFLLETIVLCGEYCRLFKFNHIEELAWRISYKLATGLKKSSICLYVTSRSISLRSINHDWIMNAEKHVEQLQTSSKNSETDVVILFWLSLTDFYLDCKKIQEAKELFKKVKEMPNFKLLQNTKLYIYAADIEFRNYFVLNNETSQESYVQLLVKIHYMLISLSDYLAKESNMFWYTKFKLFAFEQMYEVMCNITIPMYSLLSYREISAHLIYGLEFAQKSGMTLRIAQFLKYNCYIYLLRTQVEEVETKLQDLEHILCLEHFQPSRSVKTQVFSFHDNKAVSMKNGGASPELNRKNFAKPHFMLNESDCRCFTCTHISYKYLVFSCTYIRAQQYVLQKYVEDALEFFTGACLIKESLENEDTSIARKSKHYKWKRHQNVEIDELYYLLDFSMLLSSFMPERKEDALAIIEEAVDIAEEVNLDKHPVGAYAKELYMQHYFYEDFANKLCIAPEPEIPITITNEPVSGCITPKQQVERTPRNHRRRKSPRSPIAIPVITVSDSPVSTDDSVEQTSSAQPKRTSARLVRRKLLVDEVDEHSKNENEQLSAQIKKKNTRQARKANAK